MVVVAAAAMFAANSDSMVQLATQDEALFFGLVVELKNQQHSTAKPFLLKADEAENTATDRVSFSTQRRFEHVWGI